MELAVAVAVDVTSFLTSSQASKEAYKTANLLKSLNVNALIGGEHGTGKLSLARYILPEATVYSALDFDAIMMGVGSAKSIIITNIENSPNFKRLFEVLSDQGVRVVATSSNMAQVNNIDEYFSIKIQIPPLCERPEDISLLQELFVKEAQDIFGVSERFEYEHLIPDVSQNAYSLRRQMMLHYLLDDIGEDELMGIIESYLSDKLGSNNDYREFLHLYEVPLIQAGLKRFKSQLQLSERLGLNRNTLRKKIAENEAYGLKT